MSTGQTLFDEKNEAMPSREQGKPPQFEQHYVL